MKKLVNILMILLIVSCSKEISVDVPQVDQKIVIEGYIEDGKEPYVYITKSVGFFGENDISNISEFLVTDAKVTVSNGVKEDSLKLSVQIGKMPPLVYKPISSSFIGEIGKSYTLKVVIGNEVFYGETFIPQKIKLDSVWLKEEPGTPGYAFCWGHLSDPDTLGNCYRWYQKRLKKDSDYKVPLGPTFDDKFTNGKKFDFYFQAPIDTTHDGQAQFMYKTSDAVAIKFVCMDQKTFQFWRTLDVTNASSGNPFGAPITPINNITGGRGYGCFSGFSISYDTAYVKKP